MSGWLNLAFADNKDIINATKDGRITANIENKPLNGVLKDISEKFKLELKGSMVGSESVTLNASNLTLEEMLKKLMRGYNYVLIKPDKSDKTVLMVLSKAERTKYTEPSVAGIVVAAPSTPPATVKMPTTPPTISSSVPIAPPSEAAKIGEKKDAEPVVPLYSGGAAPSTTGAAGSGDTVKIITSTGAVKEISASLLPPMPPSLSGGDTPPSIPVITAGAQIDAPTSTSQPPTVGTTGSTVPGGQQQQAGQQSTTSTDMKDLRRPQIPF